VLRFDGVETWCKVWLNGVQVGTSSGSRLPVEFDVTDVIVAGSNTLAVRVTQWAASTYLEGQDMWWLPGIVSGVSVRSHSSSATLPFSIAL
jgi:beta-galactosidase